MERRALHAEDFKNLKSYIGCTTLKRRRKTIESRQGQNEICAENDYVGYYSGRRIVSETNGKRGRTHK